LTAALEGPGRAMMLSANGQRYSST